MVDPHLGTRLGQAVAGPVETNVPLARHTTLGVGGPAAALVVAESACDLEAVSRIGTETGVDWLVVGRGSNLLVADAGWPGIAVVLGRAFRGAQVIDEAVVAGAAEPMPGLAWVVARHGLGGLSFGVAIPGTLGGAVRMNAGAHGGQMRDVLEWAEVIRLDRGGARERWHADDLAMAYRHTSLPQDAIVMRACLRLRRTDAPTLAAQMRDMQRWRREHQPLGQRSCGSVFRNPVGDSAGRLIEAAGLKGQRIGGAQISPLHANFITVTAPATAADVHRLIRMAQERVVAVHGVALATEVVMVGFDEPAGLGVPGASH